MRLSLSLAMEVGESSSNAPPAAVKDPRIIARKYQLDLCKRAVEENIIVYLGTGCGKTHIAVLLMYELGYLIRKPSRQICVFLAPTIPLVRQQAMVIENSTDFKVRSYFGNRKCLKDHHEWEKEIEESEVLVMTPQILLQCLRHCFIRMELISLLIFDECHHAQTQTRHPYAQIMKEFYHAKTTKCHRIFGMTASPTVGKGGSNSLNYTKCINSLEHLLDAKVCSVDDALELESIVAAPDIKVYFYDPVGSTAPALTLTYRKKLEEMKQQSIAVLREKIIDSKDRQKKIKHLWKMHDNLIFCLENIGLWGAIKAAEILLSPDHTDTSGMDIDENNDDGCMLDQYLSKAASVLNCKLLDADAESNSLALDTLEEPFFSKKLLVLISILSTYRLKADMKCIIFVKRIIVARTLTHILGSLKSLDFWKCEFLVGFHSGLRRMSRKKMDAIVEMFCSGQVNLLVATNVAEEGLDIQTCCLVVRFDLPETVASYIQSRGRARMQKSEYVFLVERGNAQDMKLLNDFISGEDIMNKEITCRTSNESFDALEEKIYKVYTTGASISTGCSVSLLHRYCDKLPRDIYFTPSPKFFYMDELDGTICRIILPPNAPLRQVESLPCPSKDEARRRACLNACMELHARGALTDYLLPGLNNEKNKGSSGHASECDNNEDEYLREELYEMLVPQSLRVAWSKSDSHIIMHSYYIRFVPIPEDRLYWPFGLFVKHPLPKEAETMIVDLHLAQGRIVKTDFQYSGTLTFDSEEIMLAQNFQEMWLKIILDRSEFFPDFVALGKNDVAQQSSSTFYLLIPVQKYESGDNLSVDWTTMRRCLSSQIFRHPRDISEKPVVPKSETLKLLDGCVDKGDIMGSLVFTPHNKLFFFVDGILDETNASSRHESRDATYAEYYRQRFGIQLLYPEQPLLKAKQLFLLRNLLHNRLQETTEARAKKEQFVRLPAELCSLKIIGFSKDIGSSLSLLPSLMHRLENLLVAIELKDLFSSSFPEASEVRVDSILEALTTEKCLERLSLERFEVLGDAFLKYVVGRHSFLSYEGLDEGQLTKKRSGIVKNSHLCELAIRNNLQVYVCDELFEPSQFFALGRPCKVICNADTESTVHFKQGSDPKKLDGTEAINVKCTKSHRWLHRKTIADVVEALVGAFLVESGFKAAIAFLQWIGIQVNFEVSDVYRAWKESENNMSLNDIIDVASLEEITGYKFQHRGLLLQAFVHPSYNKHPGGCYQKLEFVGDAVLEYLITSYLYSVYPDLKPGQITDMRSIIVNNNSFAHIAVLRSFHLYVIKDSQSLTEAVKKFESFVQLPNSERDLLEEPACPKVLGDVVESFIGAILLDTGFNLKHVWRVMLQLLDPALGFTSLQINPIRELCELCQSCNFELKFPDPVKDKIGYSVKVEVDMAGTCLSFSASNHNSKAARRMASQEALSELKSLGHKHKHKSLEEIIQLSRKKEAELIGYDEEPINMDTDSIDFGKLALGKSEEASYKLNLQIAEDTSLKKSAHHKQSSHPVGSIGGPRMCSGDREQYDQVVVDQNGPDGDFENGKYKDTNGVMTSKSAKSQLYEICSANCWSPPSFECWKEEGPSHLRMFTYKVIVEVETNSSTSLECFSEAKPQKKAAQEHAAEGALWYLKHLGCTLKP